MKSSILATGATVAISQNNFRKGRGDARSVQARKLSAADIGLTALDEILKRQWVLIERAIGGSVIGTNNPRYCGAPKKALTKPIFITALNSRWLDGLFSEPRPSGNPKQDGDIVCAQRRRNRSINTSLAMILTVMLACANAGRAQTSQPTHQPSSEVQKEGDYYVGNWKLTGETKTSPFGPGGEKFESSERLEWLPGGFFLLARSYEGEKWTQLTIIGYDKEKKVLTHTAYNANGEIEVMEGTDQGDTEIWSGEGKASGKPVKQRLTIKRVSPAFYTFKFEMAPRGGNWSLVYEGQGTKER